MPFYPAIRTGKLNAWKPVGGSGGGTPAPDETPDAFTFTDVSDAALSTQYTSNTITVAGLGSGVSVAVTVAGATYSKNGGAYTSSAGTAQNGDTFAVRHTSSASNETATNTTLTIGGVSDTFTTTTEAETDTLTISTATTTLGDPIVGQTLYDAETDTYNVTPDSFARQWYKDGVAISGETGSAYLVQDADAAGVLRLGKVPIKAGYTSSAENLSANTAAVANINLANAITAFTRTSSSGVTPMTYSIGLGSNVYSDYILWARVYADAGLSTKTQDVSYTLTVADLEGTTDISAQLAAAGLTAIGDTEWLRIGVVAHSPAGTAYSYVYPDAISPTDAPAATVWSAANSHPSWTLAGNSAICGAFNTMAKADNGHSGTGDWSFTITPSQDQAHMLGLANLTEDTDTWVGGGSNSKGFRNTDGQGFNTGGVNLSFTWVDADVITVRLKNGKMYVAKNGTYSTGMDPSAETGGIDVSGLGALYPAVSTNTVSNEYVADFNNWPA